MKKSMLTFASALGLAALSASAAFAQFSGINGAVVTQDFHDDALSVFYARRYVSHADRP